MKNTRFITRSPAVCSISSRNTLRLVSSDRQLCFLQRSAAALLLGMLLALGVVATPVSSPAVDAEDDVAEWTLERLMNTPVTILKTEETLSRSPAAISVVTQDDIRRIGAASIPEALRWVPGLEVARLDASQWAVTARGFNGIFANKLLVLQDGRSIYSPLFSGTFWDVQGTMLEDIERIEVIRGPGATLWGANAVNGVINIITRSAKDTQGGLLVGGGGSEKRGFTSIRYGGKMAEDAYARVYGTYINHGDSVLPDGSDAHDAWEMFRGGFRVDWDVSDIDLVTFQGDVYGGSARQVFGTYDPNNPPFYFTVVPDRMKMNGGNLLGRWTHTFTEKSDLQFQMYYDRTERRTQIIDETRDTFDLDLQYHLATAEWNKVIVGAGYRLTSDNIAGTPTISFDPARRTTDLFSAFIQDEIMLVPDRLWFTAGTKVEHNDFTGWELQPGGRLLWTPHENHTFWGSVSRAVRTPSRTEDDSRYNQIIPPDALFPGSPVGVVTLGGNRNLKSEDLTAYEIGYRAQPHPRVSLDLAAFYNEYDNLRTLEPSMNLPNPPPPPPAFIIPQQFDDNLYGETYGFEAAVSVEVTRWWRLQPAYTFLRMQLHTRAGSSDTTSEADEDRNPRHQFSLRSSMDLPHNLTLDCMVRYVDELPANGIDSYVTLDLRLGWRPTRNLEFSIVGQDLVSNRHPEFGPAFVSSQQAEVPRSVYGKITWQF